MTAVTGPDDNGHEGFGLPLNYRLEIPKGPVIYIIPHL